MRDEAAFRDWVERANTAGCDSVERRMRRTEARSTRKLATRSAVPERALPPVDVVRRYLDYDPETGVLTWKARAPLNSITKGWNAKYAGRPCGWADNYGYINVEIDGARFKTHRLAYLLVHGVAPDGDVDHKDGDPQNNRADNLRLATRSQNQWNGPRRLHNTSGVKGVYQRGDRWIAQIGYRGEVIYLGYFKTRDEAQAARLRGAKRLHGEYARLG